MSSVMGMRMCARHGYGLRMGMNLGRSMDVGMGGIGVEEEGCVRARGRGLKCTYSSGNKLWGDAFSGISKYSRQFRQFITERFHVQSLCVS